MPTDPEQVSGMMGTFPTPPSNFPAPRSGYNRPSVRPEFTKSSAPTTSTTAATNRLNTTPSSGGSFLQDVASTSLSDVDITSSFGLGFRGIIHPFPLAVGASPLGVDSYLDFSTPFSASFSTHSVSSTDVSVLSSNQISHSDMTALSRPSSDSTDTPALVPGETPSSNSQPHQKLLDAHHSSTTPQEVITYENNFMTVENKCMFLLPHLMKPSTVLFPLSRDLPSSGDRFAGVSLFAIVPVAKAQSLICRRTSLLPT
jgi:hypothetical protein